MDVTKEDQIHIENVSKMMKRGTFTLDGEEASAFHEMRTWLKLLHERVVAALAAPKSEKLAEVASKKKRD